MRALILFALLGITGCTTDPGAPNAAGICPLIREVEMPVETHGNMLFVRGTIGGDPVTLLVDTGAERTLLTEATVERLHLPRDFQHVTRTYGIGTPSTSWDARLPDGLTLGGTRLPVDTVPSATSASWRLPVRRLTACWAPIFCWPSTSTSTCRPIG
jgi:hypothetical protein